jgi:predicted Zn finger-like uncharacterized protein
MPIRAVCPECQKAYQVAETAAGKNVRCKNCGSTIKIPEPEPVEDDALFSQLEEDGIRDFRWLLNGCARCPGRAPRRRDGGARHSVAC